MHLFWAVYTTFCLAASLKYVSLLLGKMMESPVESSQGNSGRHFYGMARVQSSRKQVIHTKKSVFLS